MRRFVLVVLVAVSMAVLPAAHCNPGPAWQAFVDCESSAVKTDLPDVLPLVMSILMSGGTDTASEAALAGLGVKFGVDTVECAVVAAVVAFQQSVAPASQPASLRVWVSGQPAQDDVMRGLTRGQIWLKSHGVSTKAKP